MWSIYGYLHVLLCMRKGKLDLIWQVLCMSHVYDRRDRGDWLSLHKLLQIKMVQMKCEVN